MPRVLPLFTTSQFLVSINNQKMLLINEISLPEVTFHVESYREGKEGYPAKFFFSPPEFSEITIKKGVSYMVDRTLIEYTLSQLETSRKYFQMSVFVPAYPRSATWFEDVIYNTWYGMNIHFYNCVFVSIRWPTLSRESHEVIIEEATVQFQSFDITTI